MHQQYFLRKTLWSLVGLVILLQTACNRDQSPQEKTAVDDSNAPTVENKNCIKNNNEQNDEVLRKALLSPNSNQETGFKKPDLVEITNKKGEKGEVSLAFLAISRGTYDQINEALGNQTIAKTSFSLQGEEATPAMLIYNVLKNEKLKEADKKELITRIVKEKNADIYIGEHFSLLKAIAIDKNFSDANLSQVKLLFDIPELIIPDKELHHVLPLYLQENGLSLKSTRRPTKAFKQSIEGEVPRDVTGKISHNLPINGNASSKEKLSIKLSILGFLVYYNISNVRYLEALLERHKCAEQLQSFSMQGDKFKMELSLLGVVFLNKNLSENGRIQLIKTLVKNNPNLLNITQKTTTNSVKKEWAIEEWAEDNTWKENPATAKTVKELKTLRTNSQNAE